MQVTRNRGFSLIELIVAMAIIAIVTAVALPAFQDSVRKSRRADAHAALLQVQTNQEKWRANNTTYTADLTNLGFSTASNAVSTDGYYTINITADSNTGIAYEATAVPKSGTAQASDSCSFTLTNNGPDISSAANRACWGK
jgi:type IV pilus assembly protein PilE